MGDDAPGRSECRFRRPRRKISRWRQGVRSGAERAARASAAGQAAMFFCSFMASTRCSPRRSTARRSSPTTRRPPASRCCSPGRRAESPPPMSTISIARPRRATASSTRCVSCSPATRKRSMCSPIPWAIGSRSRRSGRSRSRATSVTRTRSATSFLAAPDIDIDVFKSQMRRFGKPRKPFYVVLSQDDRALFLSRTIAGGVTRVGDSARYRGARLARGDRHRSHRPQGDRRDEPRQIRPTRLRRARAARLSPGMPRITSERRGRHG